MSVSNMVGQWLGIVQEANQQAYLEIVGTLGGRGFAVSDIDQWALRRAYNLSIACYWALVNGGGLGGYSDQNIEKLNLIPALIKMAIVNTSGNEITPSLITPSDSNSDGTTDTWGGAAIVGGRLSQDGYRFNMSSEF